MTNDHKIIRNVQLWWVKINTPVEPFGTPQYELQIRFHKKRTAEMEEFGNIKETDDPNIRCINMKKKAFKADGSEAAKIIAVDKYGEPVDPTVIGNGSEGNVKVYLREYQIKTPKGVVTREGISVMPVAIQVTNLIEYKQGSTEGFDFEERPEDSEEKEEEETQKTTKKVVKKKPNAATAAKRSSTNASNEDDDFPPF